MTPMSIRRNAVGVKSRCNVCFKYDEHKLFDQIMTFVYQVPDILYRMSRTINNEVVYGSNASLPEISTKLIEFVCPLKMIDIKSFQNFESIARLLLDKKMGCCAICNYLAFMLLKLNKEVSTILTYNTVVYTCQECKKRETYANQCSCKKYSRTGQFLLNTSLKRTDENKIRWGESALFQLENKIVYLILNRMIPPADVLECFSDIMERRIVSDKLASTERRIGHSQLQGSKSTPNLTESKLRSSNKSDDKHAAMTVKYMLKSLSDDTLNMPKKIKQQNILRDIVTQSPRTGKLEDPLKKDSRKNISERFTDRVKTQKALPKVETSPKGNIGDGTLRKAVLTTKRINKTTVKDSNIIQHYDRQQSNKSTNHQNKATRPDVKDENTLPEKNLLSRIQKLKLLSERSKKGSMNTPKHDKDNVEKISKLGNKQTKIDSKHAGQGIKKQHNKTPGKFESNKSRDGQKYDNGRKGKGVSKYEIEFSSNKNKIISKEDAKFDSEYRNKKGLNHKNKVRMIKGYNIDKRDTSNYKKNDLSKKYPREHSKEKGVFHKNELDEGDNKHSLGQKDLSQDKNSRFVHKPSQKHSSRGKKEESLNDHIQSQIGSSRNKRKGLVKDRNLDHQDKFESNKSKLAYDDPKDKIHIKKKDLSPAKKEKLNKNPNLVQKDTSHSKSKQSRKESFQNKREGSVEDLNLTQKDKKTDLAQDRSIKHNQKDSSRNLKKVLPKDHKRQYLDQQGTSRNEQILVAQEGHKKHIIDRENSSRNRTVGLFTKGPQQVNVNNISSPSKKVDFSRKHNWNQQNTENKKTLTQAKHNDIIDKYGSETEISRQDTCTIDHNHNTSNDNKKDRISYGSSSNDKPDKLHNKDSSSMVIYNTSGNPSKKDRKFTLGKTDPSSDSKKKSRIQHQTIKEKSYKSPLDGPRDKTEKIGSEVKAKEKNPEKGYIDEVSSSSDNDLNVIDRANDSELNASSQSIETPPLFKKHKGHRSGVVHDATLSNRSTVEINTSKKNVHRDKSSQRFQSAPRLVDDSKGLPAAKETNLSFIPHEGGGGIHYELSNGKFINLGWTKMPTFIAYRWVPIFKTKPAHPERSLFRPYHGDVLYNYSGKVEAKVYDSGDGYLYYKNGSVALSFYRYRKRYRYAIFSPGIRVYRGCVRPATLLAAFDNFGNGVVYDENGQARIRYNQYEGEVLDRVISPLHRWHWRGQSNKQRRTQDILVDVELLPPDMTLARLYTNYMVQTERTNRHQKRERSHVPSPEPLGNKYEKLTEKVPIQNVYCKINDWFSLKIFSQEDIKVVFREGATCHTFAVGVTLSPKLKGNRLCLRDSVTCGYYAEPPRTNSLADLYSIVHKRRMFIKKIQLTEEAVTTPRCLRKRHSGSVPNLVVS